MFCDRRLIAEKAEGGLNLPVTEEQLQVLKANNEVSHLEARTCIKEAFVALLNTKAYEDISMTDIIRKSGVSRSCVYRNYRNKNEILMEICNEPVNDVISSMGISVMDNIETIFIIGKKHEKTIQCMINAGLEHYLLKTMNQHYENASVSFYIPLWIGMIYNSFIEWARAGMQEPVEEAVERVRYALKLVAESIENNQINDTQNRKIDQTETDFRSV